MFVRMSDSGQARRLAAILAGDVAGYSRLMGDDEAATVRTLTEYRGVFSEHSARHGGRVVDTAGDSVLAWISTDHHLPKPSRVPRGHCMW